ncbi:MAG: phosphate acyltransferase PlsX [Acidimicrobiia bacterium]
MTDQKITIALDAHGTDHNTKVIVDGAIDAVEKLDINVVLVGDKTEIEECLPTNNWPDGLLHEQASDVIHMHEEPASSVRKKTDSSIVVASKIVKDNKAHALVGAGNTGAMMAAALLNLGRITGVARPGIAVELPAPGSVHGSTSRQILVDAGATIDPEPEWLVQQALMAKAYVEHRLGISEPTIGLLSNGEESTKGDELRKKTHELLKNVEGFIGNCEGRDLTSGSPTIVVTDGFTGNVALKTIEGVSKAISTMVMNVLMEDENQEAAASVIGPLLKAAEKIHPDTYGGAVLLGVNSPVVISHGSASSIAIYNALRVAKECVETDVIEAVKNAINN